MKSNLPVANVLSNAYKERSIEEVKNKVWNHITVDPRLSRPRLSSTSIIWHHFRVNLLIDFAVLLIALISSHVLF